MLLCRYRNTFKHNLCLDMLQAGFHRAFSELHMLMTKQRAAREAAGPDSVLWNEPLLENEQEKLESMKFYLMEAEEALRNGEFYLEAYQMKFTSYFNLLSIIYNIIQCFLHISYGYSSHEILKAARRTWTLVLWLMYVCIETKGPNLIKL